MFEGLFQPMHLILILIIAIFIFGPNKLPQIGAGLGKSIFEFKKALAEGKAEAKALADKAEAAKEIPASAVAEEKKA